jgi:hypothetical protein
MHQSRREAWIYREDFPELDLGTCHLATDPRSYFPRAWAQVRLITLAQSTKFLMALFRLLFIVDPDVCLLHHQHLLDNLPTTSGQSMREGIIAPSISAALYIPSSDRNDLDLAYRSSRPQLQSRVGIQ